MIEIRKKIHDNFTVEFKIGYSVDGDDSRDTFSVKTWIFAPKSLAINRHRYSSELFYRDLAVNTRLITPTFMIDEIVDADSIPINNLRHAIVLLSEDYSQYNLSSYEYHIKMFLAIVRSSVRDMAIGMCSTQCSINQTTNVIARYNHRASEILSEYRGLSTIIPTDSEYITAKDIFYFGDEYLSNIVDHYTLSVIKRLGTYGVDSLKESHNILTDIIKRERHYRISKGYIVLNRVSPTNNREFVFRMSALRRFVDSDLFLVENKKQDAVVAQQIYYSIAAGVSMVFATAVAFSFQQRYGAFTMPVFMALVVSYMLKDRIKELMRYYLSSKQRNRYYDNKTTISIGETTLGWSKEAFDLVSESNVDRDILAVRNRSSLLSADNKYNQEEIILYRKLIKLESSVLSDLDTYPTKGINEIVRFNLAHFVQKMDNPKTIYSVLSEEGSVESIAADKIYYINYVFHFEHNKQNRYKRFRVVCTRNGIIDIEEP